MDKFYEWAAVMSYITGMAIAILIALVVIFLIAAIVIQRLRGWHRHGFKQRMADGLLDVVEHVGIGSDVGLYSAYLRECILRNAPITGAAVRDYLTDERFNSTGPLTFTERANRHLHGCAR